MLLGLPIVFSSGCGGAGVEDGTVDAGPVWVTGVDAVRIGSVDDPAYAFSWVSDLAMAPDGSLYSTHRNEAAERRWTPTEAASGMIGREGEGPGEFINPRTSSSPA
jgi:hypothetical protein